MPLIGKKVLVVKGINRGAFGVVTHADGDSLRIAQTPDDPMELGVYDRIENIVRAEEED